MVAPIEKIRALLYERQWDSLIITKPLDIYYICSLSGFLNLVEIKPFLIITTKNQYIIGDFATCEIIKKLSLTNFTFVEIENRKLIEEGGIYQKSIIEILKDNRCKVISLDNTALFSKFDKEFSVVYSDKIVSLIAVKKDDIQKKSLTTASSILKKTFIETLNSLRNDMTEIELRNIFDINIHKNGAERLGVPTIISSGKHSLAVDPVPAWRLIREGEPLMIEISAGISTEAPIVGRTLFYRSASDENIKITKKILRAYENMLSWIEPGKILSKAYDVAYDSLGDLSKFLIGPCGYGLGASSDFFYISPNSNHLFKSDEALITTLSLSIPDIGVIRYTDSVLIGEKLKILTDVTIPLIFPEIKAN